MHSQDIQKKNTANTPYLYIFNVLTDTYFFYVVLLITTLLCLLNSIVIPHIFGIIMNKNNNPFSRAFIIYILIGVFVTIQIGTCIKDYFEICMYPEIVKKISMLAVNAALQNQSTLYTETSMSSLTAKVVQLPSALWDLYMVIANDITPCVIITTFTIVYFWTCDMWLGLSLLIMSIILCIFIFGFSNRCVDFIKERDNMYYNMHEVMEDILSNAKTVLTFNKDHFEKQQFQKKYNEYQSKSWFAEMCTVYYRSTYNFIVIAYSITCVLYLYNRVKYDSLQISSFIVLVIMLFQTIRLHSQVANLSAKVIISRYGNISQSIDIFNVNNPSSLKNSCTNTTDKTQTDNVCIEFQNIYYSPTNNPLQYVFEGFNAKIYTNQITAIWGYIGSGKSTLLSLILKFITPQHGSIVFKGIPYACISQEQIRSQIGYVQQTPILFNRSIYDNIVYGCPPTSKTQVEQLLASVGAHDIITRGLDSNVGKDGSALSAGQRQIVCIVRMILINKDIICLDEVTASLDTNSTIIIHKMILKYFKNKTVIIISHDSSVLQLCDQVIRLPSRISSTI